ncbi:hypothetical protein MMC12_004496 [Toensbergia leucococca]|nr:hypothetical protein [Toensbergia leucococca]
MSCVPFLLPPPMPTEDYTPATRGTLKLKGLPPSKITKHKKKRPNPTPTSSATNTAAANPSGEEVSTDATTVAKEAEGGSSVEQTDKGEIEEKGVPGLGKTDAERRHDERRRKRLDERLKREGIKTHKERVEELNRYLSNLSEHHDM